MQCTACSHRTRLLSCRVAAAVGSLWRRTASARLVAALLHHSLDSAAADSSLVVSNGLHPAHTQCSMKTRQQWETMELEYREICRYTVHGLQRQRKLLFNIIKVKVHNLESRLYFSFIALQNQHVTTRASRSYWQIMHSAEASTLIKDFATAFQFSRRFLLYHFLLSPFRILSHTNPFL